MTQESTPLGGAKVFKQDNPPGDTTGVWLDTSSTPPVSRIYDGSDWVPAHQPRMIYDGSLSGAGQSSHTHNLSSEYRGVWVWVRRFASESTTQDMAMRINGYSGSHTWVTHETGSTGGLNRWQLNDSIPSGVEGSGWLYLDGTWTGSATVSVWGLMFPFNITGNLISGYVSPSTTTLDSIQFLGGGGGNVEIDSTVYGVK